MHHSIKIRQLTFSPLVIWFHKSYVRRPVRRQYLALVRMVLLLVRLKLFDPCLQYLFQCLLLNGFESGSEKSEDSICSPECQGDSRYNITLLIVIFKRR